MVIYGGEIGFLEEDLEVEKVKMKEIEGMMEDGENIYRKIIVIDIENKEKWMRILK